MKSSIEAKVRPQGQELQKHAAKVFIHQNLLYESGFSVGKLCTIESVSDLAGAGPGPTTRVEAIAWNSLDKNVGKNVVLLSRALQKAAGFDLGQVVRLTPGGDAVDSGIVSIQDVTPDVEPLAPEEFGPWEYALRGQLQLGEYVFPGLQVNNLFLLGPKRSFIVTSVDGGAGNVARCSSATAVQIRPESAADLTTAGTPSRLQVDEGRAPSLSTQLRRLNRWFDSFGTELASIFPASSSSAMVIQGSPGTGKTMVLDLIASTNWGQVIRIDETDKASTIEEHFKSSLAKRRPTIILIEDLQKLVGKDHASRRANIKAIRDGLATLAGETERVQKRPDVVVVAACRDYLEDLPEGLQQEPFFDQYITLPIPDVDSRRVILESLMDFWPAEKASEYAKLVSEKTHAYTGRDLKRLLRKVRWVLSERGCAWSDPVEVTWKDFQRALEEVRPTAMQDITLKPPTVRWADIGGYADVKEAMQRVLNRPKGEQDFMSILPKGVLLYGPPGCSKTMTAQAMATESGYNFFAVKGGELLNMYVGETERSIRNLFKRAREASPSIIFFDEIDSIAGGRSTGGASKASSGGGGGGVQAVTTLLTEMDGFEQMGNVFVLAATNRPDQLDEALLRPGRFDELIYVPLPDDKAREAILASKARALRFKDVDVAELARLSQGFSGAEIANICNKAFVPYVNRGHEVTDPMGVLRAAVGREPKQVTRDMLEHFETWRQSMR